MFFCVVFFFLLIRHPPISTLFPYTTLFRSSRMPGSGFPHRKRNHHSRILSAFVERPRQRLQPEIESRSRHEPGRDRKSTRLNSSHRCISYAVFCLKKKNNKKNYNTQQKKQH